MQAFGSFTLVAVGLSHVVFVASATIEPGQQLLVDYGAEYWASTGHAPDDDL